MKFRLVSRRSVNVIGRLYHSERNDFLAIAGANAQSGAELVRLGGNFGAHETGRGVRLR